LPEHHQTSRHDAESDSLKNDHPIEYRLICHAGKIFRGHDLE